MGQIYLITGNGAGKTTSALGLAMRAIGHNGRVVMIQFMKWWKETGEFRIQEKLGDNYKVYQFGRETWLKISKKKPKFGERKFSVEEIKNQDRIEAMEGLRKAKDILSDEKPDLLILDEVCLAIHSGLLRTDEVLDVLSDIPEKTTVVLTGRGAPKALIKAADFVSEIKPVKYPKNIPSKEGIQY